MKLTKECMHVDDVADLIAGFDKVQADILISYVSRIYESSDAINWFTFASSLENFAKENINHKATLAGFCFIVGAELEE